MIQIMERGRLDLIFNSPQWNPPLRAKAAKSILWILGRDSKITSLDLGPGVFHGRISRLRRYRGAC